MDMSNAAESKQFIYHYEANPAVHDQENESTKPFNVKRVSATNDDGSIPMNLTTVTSITGVAMASILLICGYHACSTG